MATMDQPFIVKGSMLFHRKVSLRAFFVTLPQSSRFIKRWSKLQGEGERAAFSQHVNMSSLLILRGRVTHTVPFVSNGNDFFPRKSSHSLNERNPQNHLLGQQYLESFGKEMRNRGIRYRTEILLKVETLLLHPGGTSSCFPPTLRVVTPMACLLCENLNCKVYWKFGFRIQKPPIWVARTINTLGKFSPWEIGDSYKNRISIQQPGFIVRHRDPSVTLQS